ncbi:hypothetical protein FRB93_010596 [Tulasnella sp. JGI-2019a]|nr:hypothetical protein FRB93_010596 [Tulasnella sp. JGI-2019a]
MDHLEYIESNRPSRSIAPVEWLSFSGHPSENVRRFVRGVHRFGFSHGRHNDSVWMADYAYGCLDDEALEWFDHLDAEVRRDWSRLRPAIMETFLPRCGSMSRCRIKVVLGAQQQRVARIRMLDSGNSDTNYPFLGVENERDICWTHRACQEGLEGDIYKRRAQAKSSYTYPASSKIWTIKKPDAWTEELCMQWIMDSGSPASLDVILRPSSMIIYMCLLNKTFQTEDEQVKLILERVTS